MSVPKLRVKVLSRLPEREWLRYFPGPEPEWGDCRFLFAPSERHYDWLVVYNDLPPRSEERFSLSEELLACAGDNTLLVTYEPATVKIYGPAFTDQFGHVLTSQTESELPHRRRIYSQPAMRWYYGKEGPQPRTWREMHDASPEKSRALSTVAASKQHKTRVHQRRDEFIRTLKSVLPHTSGKTISHLRRSPPYRKSSFGRHAARFTWRLFSKTAYCALTRPCRCPTRRKPLLIRF